MDALCAHAVQRATRPPTVERARSERTPSGLGHLISDTVVSHRPGGNNTKVKYLTKESFDADALANMRRKDTRNERYINGTLESGSTRMYLNQFQRGTGRLVRAERDAQSDTLKYDLAGNIEFVEGRYRHNGTFEDRASFYGMDGMLHAADYRAVAGIGVIVPFKTAFEEFRCDALGRRVLTWARRRDEPVRCRYNDDF